MRCRSTGWVTRSPCEAPVSFRFAFALRQIERWGGTRAAGPALVREGNREPRLQSLRSEGLLHLAVELPLDHHVDQAGAEARAPDPLGRRPPAFLPIEHEGEPQLGARDRPAQIDAA